MKKPADMSEEVFQLMVNQKHQIIAWCTLFVPEADRNCLDALILDASCQSRTAGLLDAEKIARTELVSTGTLSKFVQLAKQFLADHAGDLPPSRTRIIADVYGGTPPSDELLGLIQQIHNTVGALLFRHAGLCYTNSANANTCFDEMGGMFGWTSDPVYIATTGGTDGSPVTRVNHLYDLRAELAELATGHITTTAWEAASAEFKQATLPDTPTAWEHFAD